MDEERTTSQDGCKRALSVEKPAVPAAPPPPPVPASGDDAFDFDPAAPFDAVILALPSSFGGGLEEYSVILGDEEEELDDVYDDDDDDIELEGNDQPVIRFWNGEAAGSHNDLVARTVTFLGQPARFASYQDEGMAAFMRLAAVEAPPPAAGVIIVHYRYHRFTRPRSGGRGIEAPDYGTDLHHVRYLVPLPAVVADPASSLRLVDASLAGDVYPYRSHAQLQALWSGLLAAAPVRVPPRATGLVVTVDVGVLRSGDRTPECMECLRSALAEKAREADASPVACGHEQHLPAPVRCDDEPGEVAAARPAKRRRLDDVVAGEVCAICHEVLEQQGLAAWPRCSHVFHGKCLEQLLATVRHRCPMCRSTLSLKGMFD
ncbi:uncharacterized protein LOC120686137 [Panicum virgatum]|uniref:RING-type domain-containing protein n=1 Tax=Panicum virgatum TaxID=38727 RepID=A0A8T0PAI7_PANVG|nr:uncharacterized protein LOC120686137 [Panicum virgatum]KAG2557988.1 hypothetical protein PVAP13_8NG104801 [Panicum virgatum]